MQSDARTSNENGQPVEGPGTDGNGRAAHADEHVAAVDLPPVSGRAVVLIVAVVLVLFAALFLLGWMPHSRRQAEARADAAEAADARPVVNVTRPKSSDAAQELVLPGDVRADQSTAVFARTSGYLKPLPEGIDIGARVKAGHVIAEISAPEVDAELEQAKATLEQANVTVGRATNEFNFNKATFERYQGLSQTGGVTAQQLDERRSQLNIATSSLKAAQANVSAATAAVKKLAELQGFQKVVAPFDGTITTRNYDAGALVSAT
jgi:multidrug efflux pump subunit AcrA (membrane-fusion protein)